MSCHVIVIVISDIGVLKLIDLVLITDIHWFTYFSLFRSVGSMDSLIIYLLIISWLN
jgi:hypothetical protein